MIVHTLKMCTGDTGAEESLVLLKIGTDHFGFLFLVFIDV